MNKFTKILLIILGIFVLSTLLHFAPSPKQLLDRLPFVQEYYQNTALTVATRGGPANIYIDGTDYGETPTRITNLPEGRYLVELERISNTPELYDTQTFYINLYRRTEAIINMEIAPDNFKTGYILSYAPNRQYFDQDGYLTIHTNLQDYQISLNEQRITENTLLNHQLEPGEYSLKVESKGHETLEFPVIIREGYNLNATIYLLPIPITFN